MTKRHAFGALITFLLLVGCGEKTETDKAAGLQSADAQATKAPMSLEAQGEGASVEFMRPKGKTREIDFTIEEGTRLSVDVSPDGRWVLFDLLGHIYRISVDGGEAVSLTQGSGVALNFHPAYSPDGKHIAFISDRSGQDNVWIMNADGSNPRAAFLDPDTRFTDPVWSPDGKGLVAVRIFPSPGRGWHRRNMTLASISLAEGQIKELLRDQVAHYGAPSFSPDGEHLYFRTAYSTWNGNGLLKAAHRIQRRTMASGQVDNLRLDQSAELTEDLLERLNSTTYAADVSGDNPAAMNPVVSPDGRYLAFALEQPDTRMNYRGHQFRGHTGIMIRDLETGEERLLVETAAKDLTQLNAQYSYRDVPGFAWTPDSEAIVAAYEGKIHRLSVDDGSDVIIPFRARVQRVISEQVRSSVALPDGAFDSSFLLWPSSSPDGSRVAFAAAGRLYVQDLPDGSPRPLTDAMPGVVQLTPDFSPDGKEVVFAGWSDSEGGHLWRVPAAGGAARRITSEPAQYLYPAFSADGSQIAVTRGPSGLWPSFDVSLKPAWEIVVLTAPGVEISSVTRVHRPQRAVFLDNGRVATFTQQDPAAAMDLISPYPSDAALAQEFQVTSWDTDGGNPRFHALMPARGGGFGRINDPVLSPDGRWLAFQSGGGIYIHRLGSDQSEPVRVDVNPNRVVRERVRVGDRGGLFPHWRNPTTVEFSSGNEYFSYDASKGTTESTSISLSIQRDQSSATVAFTDARIITVGDAGVIETGSVVMEGPRIACVGVCDVSGADHVIDASGKTIMPGLVDLHAHHTNMRGGVVTAYAFPTALDLAYGVTSIIDPATLSPSAFQLAEMTEAGVLVGPRIFSSGEFVITQSIAFGDNLEVTSPENAAYNAGYRARWGAIELKNYRLASRQQHQYLIEAARQIPITVTAEGGPLFADIGYAMDGQTGWEHLIGPMPVYQDAAQFLGRAGMHYSPTVIVAGHVNGSKEYFRQTQGLLDDAKYKRFIPGKVLRAKHANVPDWSKEEFSFPIVAEGLADLIRAGGYGALGEHGEQPGIGTHWELWAYADALTPLEAIKVATYDGAHFVGLDRELGSIEAGKLADLIVLNSNPLENIRNSADIAWVVRAGNVYDDETLDRVWPDKRPYGTPPWAGPEESDD